MTHMLKTKLLPDTTLGLLSLENEVIARLFSSPRGLVTGPEDIASSPFRSQVRYQEQFFHCKGENGRHWHRLPRGGGVAVPRSVQKMTGHGI